MSVVIAALVAFISVPRTVSAELRLVKEGTTQRTSRISFTDVGFPNATRNSQYGHNPVIQGDNLYAPDLVRTGAGWNCYYGGWKTSGQLYDRIYLGTRPDREIGGAWTDQMIISNGTYVHVNDPTVVREGTTHYMLYTAAKWVGTGAGSRFRDWINYSTSVDGIIWNPSAGSSSTEISISDPANILLGQTFSDLARPSLVRDGSKWKLWFDARIDGGGIESYLAESISAFPSSFLLIHKYPNVGNFPGFMEPDVIRRPDGTFAAVIQRHFKKLFYGTSIDGVNFTLQEVVDADHPFFVRKWVSNPGLVYDETTDELLGFAFGMTDNDNLTDHDIGFSAMHYQIEVQSPGPILHVFSEAHSLDEMSVIVFNYTDFENVRVRNPVTGQILFTQPFTEAQPGDLWRLVDTSRVTDWSWY